MVARDNRVEKVKRIFYQFDKNKDGGLNTQEMSSLIVSVNPKVRFSDEQINAILEEVFKTYHDFIDIDKGLTFEGLLRTYDDGAGDVDRDFEALELELYSDSIFIQTHAVASSSSSVTDDRVAELPKKQQNWALSPSYEIVFASTWKIVEDLEILIKRLKGKQLKDGRLKVKGDDFDTFSEPGWSREFRPSSEFAEKGVIWDESGADYSAFVKQLGVLRGRVDEAKSSEEMFDGHMGIGRALYEHHLFREGLVSFKKSCELIPMNFRPHFRAGNCLYVLRKYGEAKVEFMLALEAARIDGNHSSYLLPQIHVNLGISLEGEGMVLSACEHYREAAILCPTHFRAIKLLGSALFGVGEYKAAEKALEEAIFLKSDYADAHCDLGSTLHAMGEGDRAIQEFQKAIDLKPGHVDALYNLGGLYMDIGRYRRASEMYTRVLAARPDHWRAQVNKAVALLGANEAKEAKKALKEAFKMTNRVELHDAIAHMKHMQKKPAKENGVLVEPSKFKRVTEDSASREDLANALDIRAFQRLTRLGFCDVDLLKKEISETKVPVSYSLYSSPGKSVRKSALEVILCRLLHFLKPETFQGAVKAINKRILSILDYWDSSKVDLGMFYAVLAPICSGSLDKRKRVVFDALLWRHADEGSAVIRKVDAVRYIKFLRAIYLSPLKIEEMVEVHVEVDGSTISFSEFLEMFDNPDSGFGIMDALVKLESGDRVRHCHFSCSVCRYPISGSCFKEMKSHFNLCSQCYSEGKVPSAYKQDTYSFKEYESEADAIKDKCALLKLHSRSCTRRDP
ncbi:Calcium-binding tetratricopeptide family protein [Thalictrum thalictroides]|uniref:Calcium-binding tetratricopeptide family protein n=1 Tax=Thalictrum thalictroides TaxID=46969 RepID=A0A7J6WGQ5_THATH|nr:Calcium-binding tetratricopeptide family protein [Thalictrum thalictroides]